MARTNSLKNFLTDVADAIRNKTGKSGTILASDFDIEINNINEADIQDPIVVTPIQSQQVFVPDEGYDGLGKVIVEGVTSDIDRNIIPENIKKNVEILGVVGTHEDYIPPVLQSKHLDILYDGSYTIVPDEGYDGISSVSVVSDVKSHLNEQHMPFYLLESDDDGNLWCVNNYSTMEYSPYELDIDGNLIVNQDDEDTAIYWINENMELEVEVNG